mmetsp:Transcript_1127/g.1802  ORF Transcript_1127/g.1802 Transcript_1127/m.1802 type:complete len:201 (-) Transcript_1127:129-731(-)
MTPYKSMFGVEVFDFGVDYNLQLRCETEPTREELAEHMEHLHWELYDRSWKAKHVAKKAYHRAVKETKFQVGDAVVPYYLPDDLDVGRKLKTPWLGPYVVKKRLSDVSYMIASEARQEKESRVHVNRLRKWSKDLRETGDPRDGIFPYNRRLLRSILDHRDRDLGREYRLKSAGRTGYKRIRANQLPTVVARAYDVAAKG